jgi:hypothetical protein
MSTTDVQLINPGARPTELITQMHHVEMTAHIKAMWMRTLGGDRFRKDIIIGDEPEAATNSTLLHVATVNRDSQTYLHFRPQTRNGDRAVAKLRAFYAKYPAETKACLSFVKCHPFQIHCTLIPRLMEVAEAHCLTHLAEHMKRCLLGHLETLNTDARVEFDFGAEYLEHLMETLSFLQQEQLLVDFILHFGSHGSIHCHKIVLEAICPAFLHSQNAYDEEFVLIDGGTRAFFESAVVVMDLVYGRQVDLDPKQFEEVCRFAEYLKMEDFEKKLRFVNQGD